MKGSYHYIITPCDIDADGRATLTALCHYVLAAAGEDADRNGFGVEALNVENHTWVLSRMALEISRMPAAGDSLTVRTWVSEVGRVMTTRNMVVIDAGGQQIAAAVTQWAIIDVTRRTAVDIRTLLDYRDVATDELSPIGQPRRLAAFVPERDMSYMVTEGDIDFNSHMNSLRYIDLMVSMLADRNMEEVRRFDIAFLHEALLGQSLSVRCCEGMGEANEALFEIAVDGGETICRAALSFYL